MSQKCSGFFWLNFIFPINRISGGKFNRPRYAPICPDFEDGVMNNMHRTGAFCACRAAVSRLRSALAILMPVLRALSASTSHSAYVQGAKVIYFVLGPVAVALAALLQRFAATLRIGHNSASQDASREAALGPTERAPGDTVP